MYKKIHFVGVGGSGMFPLACICRKKNIEVSGSDSVKSKNTDILSSLGVKIFYSHSFDNVEDDVDLLVYSGAIKQNNEEILSAKEKNIEIMTRSKFLGFITKDYDLIAVSGSHGKSTVSSMITQILIDCKKDPTSIIGAHFNKIDGNSILGKSNIAVCEACEYLDSFLDLEPKVGVILNIDNDHLDYFKNLENEKKSFLKFANNCKNVVINKDNNNAVEISNKMSEKNIVYFGINNQADFCAKNLKVDENACFSFDLFRNRKFITKISLKVRGEHNVSNCLSSICVCDLLGLKIEDIKKSVENFYGVNRRFQFIGEINGISIFDDFAHHPTEIESTLKVAKNMKHKRIIVIFQPHTFSRTFNLIDDFAKVLSIPDKVVITDILPVREENIYGITSEDLSRKIKNSIVIREFNEISEYLKENTKNGDMIITMGGGDIYKCANIILDTLREKFKCQT